MNEYQRNCPSCDVLLNYKHKDSRKFAEKNNRVCKSCVTKGEKNPMYGKHLSKESQKKRLETVKRNESDAWCRTPEARRMRSDMFSGFKNPMHGKTFYDVWVEKYGKEEADKRLEIKRENNRRSSSGSNNPMFGKPSPKGSGNGWKGHYKGFYFRSLRELSFFVNYIERFNMKYDSLEKAKYKIKYTCPMGQERNYFGDFLINDKYFVEVKPKKLQTCPTNMAKFEAARVFCEENGLIFKLIDPKMNFKQIENLYKNGLIKFSPRYEEKFQKFLAKQ